MDVEPKRTTSIGIWTAWLLLTALTLVTVWPALVDLAERWLTQEAYSHGFIIVGVAAYLGFRALRNPEEPPAPSAWFMPFLIGSLLIIVPAAVSELYVLVHYGLFGIVCSLILGVRGWKGLKLSFIPLLLLFLAIPMPGYFESNLTLELKLLSSELGAEILHLLGVPVFNDGNVIDLGDLRLQVADACAGLNYLFPLMSIGVILAGFLDTSVWRRVLVVALTVPITIVMNVIRIAVAGLLVRHVGAEAASGFIHDFQGWMVFVVSLVILIPCTAAILRIGARPTSLKAALRIDFSLPDAGAMRSWDRVYRRNLIAAVLCTGVAASATVTMNERNRAPPARSQFAVFPTNVGAWSGTRATIDSASIAMLNLTDYLLSDYRATDQAASVELFASYYAAQTRGATPHSPDVCLPGSGWEILTLERTETALPSGETVPVNRALIQSGNQKRLVYYWFQQRGRLFANEFAMKWFIFQDAALMQRTDGAFLRITTPVENSASEADQRLQSFMQDIWPVLPEFIPPAESVLQASDATPREDAFRG